MKMTSFRQLRAVWHHTPWCIVTLLLIVTSITSSRSEEPSPTSGPGVLLLEGNRIIEGRIKPQGDTFAVDQPAGTLIVARSKVTFVGANLQSVYVHLREQLPKKPQADDHVDLARWCLGYKLNSEARFELQAALEAEPAREDIRRNLVKLDSLLKQTPREPEKIKPETPAERFARGTAGINIDVETLGGLSREAGQEFTRRIQPILMHNCMNARCHGSKGDNAFKLELVRYGAIASRSTTEKNLLSLLEYIDQDSPKDSKLWELLKTNHGAAGRSIFVGAKGSEQLKTFQTWMISLSKRDPNGPEVAKARPPSAGAIKPVSHKVEEKPRWQKGAPRLIPQDDDPPTPESVVVARHTSKPPTSEKPKSQQTPKNLGVTPIPDVEPIVSDERPEETVELPPEDPFNPDEFNSRQRIKKKLGE